jgi:hypothetical protein
MKKAKNIKPIWEDYRNWEDYKNGMYENGHSDDIINQCYEILTSDNLKQEMYDTTITYEISTQVNFTNQMFNPVSWLGQATCNRLINATAQETCNAWMMMSKEQQEWANNIAKEVIEEWRNKYEERKY